MSAVLRVAGCGFGPSNLALAIALADSGMPAGAQAFFEQQPRFGWHRGMLLDGARMQVSFLKDLVTMRTPTSPYSFVAYLHDAGRLADFVNGQAHNPLRVEFHAYLEWAAARLAAPVSYGTEVVDVRPVPAGGVVDQLDVVVRAGGRLHTRRTENLVLGTGLRPYLPPEVVASGRVLHSESLLPGIAALTAAGTRPRRLVVVGAGQSAAEALDHLHARFTDAEVCALFARYGYSTADDTPFTNRIFDPAAVDTFYTAPAEVRESLLTYHGNTNYSVVDAEVSAALYGRHYQELVSGRPRLRILNTSRVRAVEEDSSGVRLTVECLPTGAVRILNADAVVFATGYRPVDPIALLGGTAADCKRDPQGRLLLHRDFRVVTSDAVRCGIYVHGAAAEHSHGLSAGLLSTTAVRAGEIARSLIDRLG